jgi:STE24 endopeptidase
MKAEVQGRVGLPGARAALARRLRGSAVALVREEPPARFDPQEADSWERAVRYSREKERLWLLSTVSDLGFGALALGSGAPRLLAGAIRRRAPRRLRDPLFVLAWSGVENLSSLPLAYYGGHVVERRHDLSNQTARAWALDYLKGFAVGAAVNTPASTGFLWLARRYPRRWWLIASGLALPFTALLAGLYPVLIAPLFNRYEPLDDPGLEERIKALAEREGVRVSRVMRMDLSRQTKKANAYFTGVGGSRRIVLADTLLAELSADEVEVVVAHELAHQVHRDQWRLMAVAGGATFAGAYALHRVYPTLARWTGSGALGEPESLPVISLAGSALSLLAMPFLNGYIRRIERQADAYAVRLTGAPRAFIGAMRGLQRTNLSDPDPPRLVRLLLHSHPSLGERIRWAEAQAEEGPESAG